MKKLFIGILCFLMASLILLVPATAYGQEIPEEHLKIQILEKGEIAKFNGFLFSVPLVVKMKVEKDFMQKKFAEDIRYEVEKTVAEWQARLEKNTIEHEALIKKLQAENVILNEQVDFCHEKLEQELKEDEKWYKSPYFVGIVGFLAGAGLTVAVIYAVNQ